MINKYRLFYEGRDRTFFFLRRYEMFDGSMVKFYKSRDGEFLIPEGHLQRIIKEQEEARWR